MNPQLTTITAALNQLHDEVDAARATEPHPAARASLLDAMVRLEEAQESIRVAAAFIAGTPTMIDPATIPTE